MTSGRLRTWLLALGAYVAAVLAITSTGVVPHDLAVAIDDAAQLSAGLTATGLCWWTARRTDGPQRAWRRLMGLGMAGWSVGQALWSWYQVVSDTPLPSPSLADVGYLTLPVLALPALLALAAHPPQHTTAGVRHAPVVFLLDSAVLVGSLFTLTWSTALGTVVRSGAPTTLSFVVAMAYPLTDLVLVAIVGLLAVTARVPQRHRVQLALLGSGLVAIAVSDSVFAYVVSSGADEMPPISNAGFIAGPLLIGLAALAVAGNREAVATRAHRRVERAHLLLPYVLVAVTGSVVVGQTLLGREIDAVEATTALAVLIAVLVRQVITLLENVALLERISEAQAELHHRAHHDPLTGLANRALFGTRLDEAVARHRADRRHFTLIVVDLDDFKEINDRHGHAVGDRLLHAVGERLRGCVRSGDTVARLGGDEFAVVLDAPPEAPARVGERLLAALGSPFSIEGRLLSVGACLGVVEAGGHETAVDAEALLRRADGAMYAGKRRGKGVAVTSVTMADLAPPGPPPGVAPEGRQPSGGSRP